MAKKKLPFACPLYDVKCQQAMQARRTHRSLPPAHATNIGRLHCNDERLAPEHELENNDGSNALTYRHVLVLVDRFDFASKYVNGLTFLNVLFQRKVPWRTMSDIQSQLLMGSAERDKARIFPWDGTKQEFSLETCATPLQVHPK